MARLDSGAAGPRSACPLTHFTFIFIFFQINCLIKIDREHQALRPHVPLPVGKVQSLALWPRVAVASGTFHLGHLKATPTSPPRDPGRHTPETPGTPAPLSQPLRDTDVVTSSISGLHPRG